MICNVSGCFYSILKGKIKKLIWCSVGWRLAARERKQQRTKLTNIRDFFILEVLGHKSGQEVLVQRAVEWNGHGMCNFGPRNLRTVKRLPIFAPIIVILSRNINLHFFWHIFGATPFSRGTARFSMHSFNVHSFSHFVFNYFTKAPSIKFGVQ